MDREGEVGNTDAVQGHVTACRKAVVEHIKPNLCLVHFFWTGPDMSGGIRRTSVKAKPNTVLANCSGENDTENAEAKHGTALKRYVRHLKRKNTFLNLVADMFRNGAGSPTSNNSDLVFTISVTSNTNTVSIDTTTPNQYSIKLSKEFRDKLLPHDAALDFLKTLYRNTGRCQKSQSGGPIGHDAFDAEMYVASVFDLKDSEKLRGSCALRRLRYALDSSNVNRAWLRLLHIVQSALLYMEGGQLRDQNNNSQGRRLVLRARSLLCGKPSEETLGRRMLPPIGALVLVGEKALEPPQKNWYCWLEAAAYSLDSSNVRTPEPELALRGGRDPWMKLRNEMKSLFGLQTLAERAYRLTCWTLCLLDGLRNSVHEGKALEYWFVIGDRSEFDDHAEIDIVPIDTGMKNLRPCLKGAVDQSPLKPVLRELAKEHFPWFAFGKYALFWDVSKDDLQPIGLVKLRGRSWVQAVTEAYRERQELTIPPCVIGYQDRRKDSRGVLSVKLTEQSNGSGGDRHSVKVYHLVTWTEATWCLGAEEKNAEALAKALKDLQCLEADQSAIKNIVSLCSRLAGDPDRGGSIVIVDKKADRDGFMQMGKPWDLRGSDGKSGDDARNNDDVLALMSHDGATVWSKDDNLLDNLKFRCFLTPNLDADVQSKFEKSFDAQPTFPLRSAGTRRWSSAMTALKKGVVAVVVVSQDGDLQIWSGGGKVGDVAMKRLPGATVVAVSADGETQKFVCEAGNGRTEWVMVGEERR